VLYTFASLAAPVAVSELVERGRELAVALSFIADLPGILDDLTITIVLDRSGSMSGSKWRQAQRAAQLFVRSLPAGSKFNVIGFGTNFESVFANAASANNPADISNALAKIGSWGASLGGTNLAGPLRAAIAAAETTDNGIVLLVTDGCANDSDAVQRVLAPLRGRAESDGGVRISALGIGRDVSTEFLTGIANSCRGRCKLIGGTAKDERIESAVVSLLGDAVHFAAGCTLGWGPLEKLPDFHASPMPFVRCGVVNTAFALCTVPADQLPPDEPIELTVAIAAGQHRAAWKIPLRVPSVAQSTETTLLHQLAARRIVQATPDLVDIALRHSVLCPALGFVTVGDATGEATAETPTLTEVHLRGKHSDKQVEDVGPLFAVRGVSNCYVDDDIEDRCIRLEASSRTFSANASKSGACCGGGGFSGSWSEPPVRRPPAPAATSTAPSPSSSATTARETTTTKKDGDDRALLDALLRFQTPEGAFHIAAGEDADKLGLKQNVLDRCTTMEGVSADAWVTALVLALLEGKLGALHSEWELVAVKARSWLASALPQGGITVARLVHEAKLALAL